MNVSFIYFLLACLREMGEVHFRFNCANCGDAKKREMPKAFPTWTPWLIGGMSDPPLGARSRRRHRQKLTLKIVFQLQGHFAYPPLKWQGNKAREMAGFMETTERRFGWKITLDAVS